MRKDFRFGGSGGQGVISLAVLLANAYGVQNNYEVAQTQSYGPAARGGACKAELVVSDERIDYVKADKLDSFVAFNKPSFDKFKGDINPDTRLFVDSTFVTAEDVSGTPAKQVFLFPATKYAEENFRVVCTNIVMMGYIVAHNPDISLENAQNAIRAVMNPRWSISTSRRCSSATSTARRISPDLPAVNEFNNQEEPMERVPELLKSKIMSADQAAQFIQTGMTIGVSGFTSIGYPKAVPEALVRSGHARDLTICVGAAVGDEIDGAMVRAGLVKKRYAHQSHKDLRNAINAGTVGYSDVHISHFPMHMNQHTGPKIDVAVVECTAVSEQGLYLAASGGSADAAVRNADKVIVEVNETLPEGLVGMHDIFEIGLPPHARIIPITKPDDRVGTPYIPCPPEKIAAIVLTDRRDEPQKFKPYSEATRTIGVNVVKFLKQEIAAGRLPENPGPIQSGVGSVGNAVLSCLASSGFHGLSMYTEVMQDSALNLIEQGVFDFVSTSSIALGEENRRRFYENIDFFKDKILLRPQEITNHPEVVRRLGVISLNTPIEVDIYGNVNSTHIMGTKMMNGIGGSGDFARNARVCIFATESVAKGGLISCIVPMVSHVDQTEHDVQVIITEQGIADLRWKTPRERAELIIENCAHPDYRPMLREYYEHALDVAAGKQTPHDLAQALSWHQRFLATGTMKP